LRQGYVEICFVLFQSKETKKQKKIQKSNFGH
jgi:hypothetical protein